jgi:hypothetical protein
LRHSSLKSTLAIRPRDRLRIRTILTPKRLSFKERVRGADDSGQEDSGRGLSHSMAGENENPPAQRLSRASRLASEFRSRA